MVASPVPRSWVAQHQELERLNAQAHVNARNKSDPFVLEALITFDKLSTIVEMLVTAETWIDRVFPRLQASGSIPDDCSMRAYYMVSRPSARLSGRRLLGRGAGPSLERPPADTGHGVSPSHRCPHPPLPPPRSSTTRLCW